MARAVRAFRLYAAKYWIVPELDQHSDHAFLLSYLRSGDTVVDVGANQGMMALTAWYKVGPSGRVHAFEPHPTTFRTLEANLALNRAANVTARRLAIGSRHAALKFTDDPDDSSNHVTDAGTVEVPCDTLDSVVSEVGDIQLLKIDVEGYERFVLEGAERTLERTACVFLEIFEEGFRRQGYGTRDILEWFAARGYCTYRQQGRELVEVPEDYVPRYVRT